MSLALEQSQAPEFQGHNAEASESSGIRLLRDSVTVTSAPSENILNSCSPHRQLASHIATGGSHATGHHRLYVTQSGQYTSMIEDSPCPSHASSVSDDSMNKHVGNGTQPRASPVRGSVEDSPTDHFGRLSLENDDRHGPGQLQDRLPRRCSPGCVASKRASSSDPPCEKRLHMNVPDSGFVAPSKRSRCHGGKQASARRYQNERLQYDGRYAPRLQPGKPAQVKPIPRPFARDSGYGSTASRSSTFQVPQPRPPGPATSQQKPNCNVTSTNGHGSQTFPLSPPRYCDKWPGLLLQPQSSPISTAQLATEVKGIYAGLVMVEAKCINIDTAQANDPNSKLGPEQWQALIALHRTLLYEHHDFLMATQHPSASDPKHKAQPCSHHDSGLPRNPSQGGPLTGLAAKYSMPARMWRHGIHAFLELLRHRRPESQDFMLAFIILAYQMMSLLYDTVPMFEDTWIECLGDLARYRMAIEEDREVHGIWGGVAGRWYCLASDKHPGIGRLYHHLGILERPSMRKVFLYSKSLTCKTPFVNAKDSLTTLCAPIAQDHSTDKASIPSVEAYFVTYHALRFVGTDKSTLLRMEREAIDRLSNLSTAKVRDFGVELVISNISTLLQLGASQNRLWQLFSISPAERDQKSKPSAATAGPPNPGTSLDQLHTLALHGPPGVSLDFVYSTFTTLIRLGRDRQSVVDTLPSVHAILVWIHSLMSLLTRLRNQQHQNQNTDDLLALPDSFSWPALSDYLNKVAKIEFKQEIESISARFEPFGARTIQYARQGIFLTPEHAGDAEALSEDFLLRGLMWTPDYFPNGWFAGQGEDDGRNIESEKKLKSRCERVCWLGLFVAYRAPHLLRFDIDTRLFASPLARSADSSSPDLCGKTGTRLVEHITPPRSMATLSAHSGSDDYQHIQPKAQHPARTYASVVAKPSKTKRDAGDVRIVDQDDMQYEA